MTNDIERQLAQYSRQILEIPNLQAQQDLMVILNACRGIMTELSKEAVNCRRHGRPSLRYRELVDQYESQTSTLEGYLIQAVMTYL